MRFRSITGLLAATAAALLAPPARAQTTGGISGQIVDANSQAPVGDAVVIAESPALQADQTAVTDATGSFELTLLPAGVYTLTVQRDSYNGFTQKGLTVRLDRTIRVKLQLVPSNIQVESMEIVSQRPVVAATSAQTGATISKEQMTLIPYGRNARGFEQVASAVPGVHGDTYGFQVNGAGSPESNYIIDGVSVSDPAFGTQGTSLLQDFVQEVDVKTGGYQAEYGRASGGILNVVTKSGGNELHGSVFVHWSPYEAGRKNIGTTFAIAAQQSQRYNLDVGVELGGPILKDKLWFFAGFAPQLISVNNYRIIQAQTDNGTGNAVLNADGTPKQTELARHNYVATTTSYQYSGKLTYRFNENHTLALALYGNPSRISGGANNSTPSDVSAGNVGSVGNGNEGFYLADQSYGSLDGSLRYSGKLLNKSLLVEANAGFHRQSGNGNNNNYSLVDVQGRTADQLRNTPAIQWQGTLPLTSPAFNDGTAPAYQTSLLASGACGVKADGFDPCPVQNYNTGGPGYLENSTLTRLTQGLKLTHFFEGFGHHAVKLGGDLSEDQYTSDKYYSGGQAFFASGSVFQGVRGFGHGSSTNASVPAFDPGSTTPYTFLDAELKSTTHNVSGALYAQDTWSILDKVVLDVGLRAEFQKISPANNLKDASGNPIEGQTIGLTNVMPRLGLIYDPTGRGLAKVYASYGRFYEYVPLDLATRTLNVQQQVSYQTNGGSCVNPSDPRTCAQTGSYSFNGGAEGIDPNLKGQYSDEYQAGVQYQVYRDVVVALDYVRKQQGRVIEDMSVDDGATYFLSNPGEPGTRGYSAVVGSGTTVLEPRPVRIYDAVTLSVNKQFSENYLVTASYTYSSLRGNYAGLFRPEDGQLNPNTTSEYDLVSLLPNKYGPLPGDVPNSFKLDAAYVYELDAKTTVNFGADLRVNQGAPYSYLGGHPIYGPGQAFILPRGAGGRLPANYQIDARAEAAYRLTADYTLGFSISVFNVTNQQAVTAVDENYTFSAVSPVINGNRTDLPYVRTAGAGTAIPGTGLNANFGQPTAYQLPFSARVGARLSF